VVRLEGLSVSYPVRGGSVPAVELVDAEFAEGAVSAVIGPSGCGKTSMVRAMAGLLPPSSGRVLVGGRELSGVRSRTAVIFQDYGLLPWKTVEANAELPLLLRRVGARERRERVAPLLEELGLSAFASFYPARLSGGMAQRVAVARAFASEPDLLLMDEPFSSLDALTRESMQETLLAVQRAHGATVVIVTHSIEEAAYLADAVYVMRGRNPGRVVARIETGRTGSLPAKPGRLDESGRGARPDDFRSSPRFLEACVRLRRELEGRESPP
jgi:NitT/TauT family transport system ATP-binding protein